MSDEINIAVILPLACKWVELNELIILEIGDPLNDQQIQDAKLIGVKEPYKIRILIVKQIPIPQDETLRDACRKKELITSKTTGLTLRYGILIHSSYRNDRQLYCHELTHVAQYERLGGIEQFLSAYIQEIDKYGYPNNPMELEARSNENVWREK